MVDAVAKAQAVDSSAESQIVLNSSKRVNLAVKSDVATSTSSVVLKDMRVGSEEQTRISQLRDERRKNKQ